LFSLAAIVSFVLSGVAPFGESDSKVILARALSGDVDVSRFAPEIGEWLRRGLAPQVEDRFTDADEMQEAWRTAAGAALERERHVPWWKRLFETVDSGQ
jgi:hypothetical protein